VTFNQSLFAATLAQLLPAESPKVTLHCFEAIASTNVKLWELLDRGIEPPAVAIARQQTAGRGQWGRSWTSEIGGLYLSVAIASHLAADSAYQLTFCTAWGIATALRDRGIPVQLKWPNDLILDRRKLGGIKTETRVQQGKIARAVVGVGLNWTNPVPDRGINLQTFCQNSPCPAIPSLESLAAIAVFGILSGYQHLQTEGVEAILASYCQLLCHQQQTLNIDGQPGVIIGVAPTGALRIRLQTPGGETEIWRMPGAIALSYDDL
jgi:BirA family biotin operon repressor/biotin-[acetyl-CoA-carboxylase] ligase